MQNTFGFDKLLPMNTGAEAVETALKLVENGLMKLKELMKIKLKLLFVKTISMEEQLPSFLFLMIL